MKWLAGLVGGALGYLLVGQDVNYAQSLLVSFLFGWVAIDVYEWGWER